jgi:hypothetical protein
LSLQQTYWTLRRKLLRAFVPEFVWPQESVIDGVSFKIRNTPYSYGTKKGLQTGEYEISERSLLQHQIKKGDVIIEMGGSIGVLTAILAHQTGIDGLVISIEASEKITAYSKKWLEAKGNIKVITGFGFPVFSVNKKLTIKSFDEEAGSLGGKLLFEINETAAPADGNGASVFDIERIMRLYNISPTIVVADVEGSESLISKIKPAYPASVRLVLMEMHEHMYGIATRDTIIANIVADGFMLANQLHGVYLFKRA